MTGEKIRINSSLACEKKAFFLLVGKRLLDILTAYLMLIVAYIPMILIAITIKLTSKGNVIFKQKRVGIDGRIFICYKFRTMQSDAPSELSTAEFSDAHKYITPFGRFLRRTSLDELPQLFNVLCGDMSLVGPRPLIPKEKAVHLRRAELGVYSVRPGITGLAQVSGRDMLCDEEKIIYDAEYVKNICLWEDTKIIFRTFKKIFAADDIA